MEVMFYVSRKKWYDSELKRKSTQHSKMVQMFALVAEFTTKASSWMVCSLFRLNRQTVIRLCNDVKTNLLQYKKKDSSFRLNQNLKWNYVVKHSYAKRYTKTQQSICSPFCVSHGLWSQTQISSSPIFSFFSISVFFPLQHSVTVSFFSPPLPHSPHPLLPRQQCKEGGVGGGRL